MLLIRLLFIPLDMNMYSIYCTMFYDVIVIVDVRDRAYDYDVITPKLRTGPFVTFYCYYHVVFMRCLPNSIFGKTLNEVYLYKGLKMSVLVCDICKSIIPLPTQMVFYFTYALNKDIL